MVWPFKRRKDMIDLSYLVKRGLIKLPEKEKEFVPMATSNSGGGDALSFLSGLASTSEPAEKTGNKNKIEDFEFKLDNLIRKVDQMIDRLDLVEKKMAKFERQG